MISNEPKNTIIKIRVTEEQRLKLQELSKTQRRSQSEIIRMALEKTFDELGLSF